MASPWVAASLQWLVKLHVANKHFHCLLALVLLIPGPIGPLLQSSSFHKILENFNDLSYSQAAKIFYRLSVEHSRNIRYKINKWNDYFYSRANILRRSICKHSTNIPFRTLQEYAHNNLLGIFTQHTTFTVVRNIIGIRSQ